MFTGIIESTGLLRNKRTEGGNVHLTFSCAFTSELKVDQSLAHNGVCLTVVSISGEEYVVTAIQQTMNCSNLGDLNVGDVVNLERCTQIGARLDGHIVQGHVDATGQVSAVTPENGSWRYAIAYPAASRGMLVEKGSVTINGVSLTVASLDNEVFEVAIIPYTYEHTSFKQLMPGHQVNLEFDIVGKYVARLLEVRNL